MKISLLTATGHYNLGDELILLQEYQFLNKRFSEAKFFIFSYDQKSDLLPKSNNIEYINYFPFKIRKYPLLNIYYFWQNIKAIASSDFVIIGGGGLIYKKEVQKSQSTIILRKIRVFIARLFFKKIIWLAIGINYPENDAKTLKFLFKGKKIFTSIRDIRSQKILENIGVQGKILPDPVFSYEPNIDKKEIKTKYVGISIRHGYLLDEKENIKQISLYLSRKGYELIFLSHSIHQDDILANDYHLLESFAKKYNIKITRTIKDTLDIYNKLDFVIGMRFHSLILSVIYKIPFIALSYGPKTEELMKELNYKYVINPKKFVFEDFIKKFDELEKNRDSEKFDLKEKYDKIKTNFYLEYNNFFDGLEKY